MAELELRKLKNKISGNKKFKICVDRLKMMRYT